MTAIYSKEGPDKAAPLHLTWIRNAAVYRGARDSDEGEPRDTEYFEALWMAAEMPAELLPPQESRAALGTIDWAQIEEEVRTAKPIEFDHACEEEFARMLDAREISWQYKPRTFAVEWDEEGNFVDCFTPDFLLPANETYIVLISPDRGASNAKTRKVKLLRRQHPEIRIELFHSAHSHHIVETVS